ncbi:MAG: hypothetical protein EOO88_53905, partial [Pedobacter sp.]
MKNIFTRFPKVLVFVLFILTGFQQFSAAQSITNYTLASSSGTFTALTSPVSPALSAGTIDNGSYNALPIGFDFWYMGIRYTTASASTNGWFTLGANITNTNGTYDATNNLATGGENRPVIAPLWDDIALTAATNFTYKTTGTAPNRIFTMQWLSVKWNAVASASNMSFQARLY